MLLRGVSRREYLAVVVVVGIAGLIELAVLVEQQAPGTARLVRRESFDRRILLVGA